MSDPAPPFPISFRGYDPHVVDARLAELSFTLAVAEAEARLAELDLLLARADGLQGDSASQVERIEAARDRLRQSVDELRRHADS